MSKALSILRLYSQEYSSELKKTKIPAFTELIVYSGETDSYWSKSQQYVTWQ